MRLHKNETIAIDLSKGESRNNDYAVAATTMSLEEKIAILEKIDRQDLINVFKDWKPTQSSRRVAAAPLDQRVSITVTSGEKISLEKDIDFTNKVGKKISTAQYIRNKTMATIDINDWANIAEAALIELGEIDEKKGKHKARLREIEGEIESNTDPDEIAILDLEAARLRADLRRITAQNEKRDVRLSGRMSMKEAETVKWRASRLSISTSDYLRFLIFNLAPNSSADAHMSLKAKQRFYVSILEVAKTGWGDPPSIALCPQCATYEEEIGKLHERVKQLETYL